MKKTKILLAVGGVLAIGIYYYVALPALNIHSPELWRFVFVMGVIAAVIYAVEHKMTRYEL